MRRREPTQAMLEAALIAFHKWVDDGDVGKHGLAQVLWRAMCEAEEAERRQAVCEHGDDDPLALSWRPIATVPKDRDVLIYQRSGAYCVAHYNTSFNRWIGYSEGGSEFELFPPTHWMPLPPAP